MHRHVGAGDQVGRRCAGTEPGSRAAKQPVAREGHEGCTLGKRPDDGLPMRRAVAGEINPGGGPEVVQQR